MSDKQNPPIPRDPERIDRILAKLREVWVQVPDWRLGQLIVNAADTNEPCPRVFYIEDDAIERKLAGLSESIRRRRQ